MDRGPRIGVLPCMHPALLETDHRPWPVPDGPWTWKQRWAHLLFAHWAVPPGRLRPHIPREVELQTFDGSAWLGVVPFFMEGLTLRGLPAVPGLSSFAELNLRTYVEVDGVPGVWFFSLDASSPLAVWAANTFFGLPYFRARMTTRRREAPDPDERARRGAGAGPLIRFTSERGGGGPAFDARYGPDGPVEPAPAGSLAHWLTERYCVYAAPRRGRLVRTEVHHRPWPLQPARADLMHNDLAEPLGLSLKGPPDLLHYARGVEVVLWPGTRIRTGGGP